MLKSFTESANWFIEAIDCQQQSLDQIHIHNWADALGAVATTQYTNLLTKSGDQIAALAQLATIVQHLPDSLTLTQAIESVCCRDKQSKPLVDQLSTELYAQVSRQLHALKPWRKGPFCSAGVYIDGEWDCRIKWSRFKHTITENITAANVLDLGGGNGYFARCVLASGARQVTVVDPNPLAWMQALALALIEKHRCNLVFMPCRIEQLPIPNPPLFDLVLCLGVIYHSKAPFALLNTIKQCTRNGATLVLETLVTVGDENSVFTPSGRYAGMSNVWAIPSIAAVHRWLQRCGFREIHTVASPQLTYPHEQRVTPWSSRRSLADKLDPLDSTKTIEGWPAPRRAVVMAKI